MEDPRLEAAARAICAEMDWTWEDMPEDEQTAEDDCCISRNEFRRAASAALRAADAAVSAPAVDEAMVERAYNEFRWTRAKKGHRSEREAVAAALRAALTPKEGTHERD